MLLFRYLSRVKRPLSTALTLVFFISLSAIINILPAIFLSCALINILIVLEIVIRISQANALRNASPILKSFILITITALISTVVLLNIPHAFLFINALPFSYGITLISLSSFIFSFEFFVRRDQDLGPNFSLINLLLFSSVRVGLHDRLITPIVPRERQQAARTAENQLALSSDLKQKLIIRQQETVAKLKKINGAVIDDFALYTKHKKELFKNKTQSELKKQDKHLVSLEQRLIEQAKELALQEAKTLETEFIEKLATQEQQDSYKAYREITVQLSRVHAACIVSYEDIISTNKKFIILEKIFFHSGNKTHFSIPSTTRVFEQDTFIGCLAAKANHPELRDPLFEPDTYPNLVKPGMSIIRNNVYMKHEPKNGPAYDTHYWYHEYQEVSGHGLSLQLCDTIDEFLDPSLVARRKPSLPAKKASLPKKESPTKSDASATHYRMTPMAPNTSISQQNIYSNPVAQDEILARRIQEAIANGATDEQVNQLFDFNM
ncbi:MAG: hypothetical protein ACO1N3_03405 [Gammaproteobacteria bacterium]